ncbi:TetR family transcriptional regulator [Ottowia thiooxydans]|uniref:TetR family transcriptional regulator n=1 Tax=Ottowia thiooxydans TaxID=219182 RepID=UPI00040C644F|nr:TetR family transcriptional regulator [Ottowia thiooxydans]
MARRTKEDAQATRSALLDAAEHVFLQRGVSRTSLNDIAQAAGVTRGALYWHFKDKADLFNAMLERVTLPLECMLPDVTGDDPIAALRQGLKHALRQIVRDEQTRRVLEIATLMVEHTPELGAIRERHLQTQREHVLCQHSALENASQQLGVALPAPAEQLAHGMHAMVHGLVFSWLLDPSFDLEATGLNALDVFLRGLGLSSPVNAHNQG